MSDAADVTARCVEKTETLSRTRFTFQREVWATSSGEGDDMDFEDAHWSNLEAEPYEDGGTFELESNDAHEYEVGAHYAFTVTGPIVPPSDRDDA